MLSCPVSCAFSALTLLIERQEGHPACKKTEWCGAGVAICLERGADLHTAQLMPLPLTVSCFSKIQIGFTFLVPAHPGSPGKGPLNGCLCVCLVQVSVCQKHLYLLHQAFLCYVSGNHQGVSGILQRCHFAKPVATVNHTDPPAEAISQKS